VSARQAPRGLQYAKLLDAIANGRPKIANSGCSAEGGV
jgi:hypothetical protein